MLDQIERDNSLSNKPYLSEEKLDKETYLRQHIRVYMREYFMEHGKNEELEIKAKAVNAIDLIAKRFFAYKKAREEDSGTEEKLKQLTDPLLKYIRTLRKELEEREGISMGDTTTLFTTFFTKNKLNQAIIKTDFLDNTKSISRTIKALLSPIFTDQYNKGQKNLSQNMETKASEIAGVLENNMTSFELKALINQTQIKEYKASIRDDRTAVELKKAYQELATHIRSYAKKSNNEKLVKLSRAYIQNILKFSKDGEIDIDTLKSSFSNNQSWRTSLIELKKEALVS